MSERVFSALLEVREVSMSGIVPVHKDDPVVASRDMSTSPGVTDRPVFLCPSWLLVLSKAINSELNYKQKSHLF